MVNFKEEIAKLIAENIEGLSLEAVSYTHLMEGNIESLNASVAAGILMYERLRCFSTKKNREVR